MTVSPLPIRRLAVLLGLAIIGLVQPVRSATYYWDFDPATAGNQNGSGPWISGQAAATANWTSSPGSTTNTAWVNGNNNANLGGTSGYTNNGAGGTLTLGEKITLNRIDKSSQTGAYIIEPGAGNYTFTLTGSGAGFGNNNTNAAAALTVNVPVGGNVELQKFNNGTVILNATNTWTGGTRITAHTTTGNTSVLQIGNGGTTGTLGSGNVTFSSQGATIGAQSILVFNRSDVMTLTQNLISGTTDPNKGILRQAGSGTLIVSSANTSFTGTAEVTAGTLQIGDGTTNGALSTATGISVASGATLRFDRSDAVSFSAPVSGTGRILKANSNTLTITGTGSTLTGSTTIEAGVLQIGNDNALSTGSTVTFAGTGSLDLNGFDQTVAALSVGNNLTGVVTGGGNSTLTTGGANIVIGGTAVSTSAALDLSATGQFVFNGPTRTLSVGGAFVSNDGATTMSTGTLTLAQDNIITASAVNVGFINAGGGNHENSGTLYLGQTNSITAANLNIGDVKNQGFVRFADGITNGTLTLRGTNAAQRMDILIGRHDSNGVVVDQSSFDSTAGTLDALVGTMTLGVTSDRARSGLGLFSMGLGTLDATTIVLGRRVSSTNSGAGTGASPTGVLELNGGTIRVQTMVFADKQDAGTVGTVTGTFNFNSGILRAQTIQGGAGTTGVSRVLRWTAGTIETYDASTNSMINDVTLALEGINSRVFSIGADRTLTMNGPIINGNAAPTVAFIKQGLGTLIMGGSGSTHTGSIELQQGILRSTASDVLSNAATLNFTGNAALDLQANSDAISTLIVASNITATVQGAGGTLTLNGTPNWNIGGNTANTTTTLDMAALSNFTFDSANADITLGSRDNVANSNVAVILAQNNLIKAKSFGIGSVVSGNTGGQNLATVSLGQTNVMHSNAITVGDYKSNVRLQYGNGISNGSLQIRATNGTSRASLLIGKGQSGAIATNAVMDVTNGSLDALISILIIGQNDNSGTQGSSTTGSLLISTGTLDATSIVLGSLSNNSTDANYAGSGTLTLAGTGTVKVGTLTFSQRSGTNNGNGFANGSFNLHGGTVQAATIQRGSSPKGTAILNWDAGTIENYDSNTDLTVTGVNLTLNGSGARNFNVTAGRLATVNSSLVDGVNAGSQAFTKMGNGRLNLTAASTYTGTTAVQDGVLFVSNINGSATGTGAIQVNAGGTLAGTGRVAPAGSAGLLNQGTLKAGGIDSMGASGLTLDLSSTTGGLTSTGTLSFDLFTNAGDNSSIASAADRLILTQATASDINLSGTLLLGLGSGSTLNPGTDFEEGDRWLLVDWSGLTGGTPGVSFSQISAPEIVLPSNLSWTYEFNQNGLFAVVTMAIPEPGRCLLLIIGLSVSCLRRRRR